MFIVFLVFILGLCIGSFVNVLVYRIENDVKMSLRSFCPSCKKQIRWFDNIPLLSWLILKAKCRNCYKKISIQYPLVELLTGSSFVAILYSFRMFEKLIYLFDNGQFSLKILLSAVILLFISFVLVLNAVFDLKTSYLLSNYIYFGILATSIFWVLNFSGNVISGDFFIYLSPYLLSATIPALFFFLLSFFSKGTWMGEGDWELVLLMGFLLGFPNIIVAFYFSFIVGAIYGIIGIYTKKFKMKTALPFGPFLVAGTYFSLLFGEQITSFYVRMFLGG